MIWGLPEALPVSPALSRLRPRAAAVLLPVFPSLAPVPAVWSERLSAEAARPVLRPVGSEASAQPAAARRPEEWAAQDAAVQPEALRGAAEVRLQAAEPPDAAAGQRQEAQDVEAPQREVPSAPAELPSVGLPSAAAWAFHRGQALPWPEPQPVARFARATVDLRIAARSERWWQAATNEVLS